MLFYSVTGFSLRWIATAAAAGPSALVIWVVAALGFFVPLVFSTLELSSRYPEEGGIYVWSKRAFGPFAAFITGWTYWGSNLPYFPGCCISPPPTRCSSADRRGRRCRPTAPTSSRSPQSASTIAVTMNVVGLNVGKWLNNVGALASWIVAALLIVLGGRRLDAASDRRRRSTRSALVPSTSLKDVIFWSTIAFAFGGVESASTMGEEIQDARRTIPRAILTAGAVITVLYLAGTLSVLLAIPKEQVSGLQGIMQAMQTMTAKVGLPWLAPIVAALVTLNALGGVGGWFAATARLPFVAGIDRFLPPAFGRLHPKWRTPYVALLVQAAIAGVFVFLGQAGTSVRGAYDALVSMGDHRLLHPVSLHVRGDDRAAARAGRPGRDARARRQAGGDRAGGDRIRRHGAVDRAGVHSAGRRAEQDARGGEGRRGDRWRWSPSASSSTCCGRRAWLVLRSASGQP